jgi:UDP-N-acetyl-D-glucosamine dehydrogenase
MSIAQDLIARAERREALFGIVGLGYVGLPLAVELANAGYRVLGFDVQQKVVDGINAGRSHVKDVTNAQLQAAVGAGRLSATTDTARLAEPDAVSICVPTPLSKFKDPDVSYIVAATEAVKRALRRGQAHIV